MTITWTTNEPSVVVDAPRREAYDFGLFSVLDFESSDRGSVPIRWDSLGCLLPTAVQDVCLHGGAPHTKADTLTCGAQFSTGFSVYAFDTPTLEIGRIDAEAARTQLEFAEQTVVEAFLLRLVTENDVAATAVGASTTPVSMLGRVEMDLASRGSKGTIIMSRFLATNLAAAGALRPDGGVLRTRLGTPVAAVGLIPAGASALEIYGVTGLKGVRGEIFDSASVNPNLNELSALAERDYSIGFECQAVTALAVIA